MYIDAINPSKSTVAVTTEEILHFAEDMGESFPDYLDWEILENVSEYRDDTGRVIDADSILGRAVLHSYKHGAKSAIKFWLRNH